MQRDPAVGGVGVSGGRVEGSESLQACARREIAEEIGLVTEYLEQIDEALAAA